MSESEMRPADDPPPDAFRMWASRQPSKPNHMGIVGATLKLGPRVCKTVSISRFGDGETGEVKKRVLTLSAFNRENGRFDFSDPAVRWYVENDEIDKLLAFLNQDVGYVGRYRVVDADSPESTMLDMLKGREEALQSVLEALTAGSDPGLIADALAASGAGVTGAELAIIHARRQLVADAAALALERDVTEPKLQRLIGDAWWLFGGRYVGVLQRRDIFNFEQHDIPLITGEGALHIVELKSPRVPSLIRQHRTHWIVGEAVHEAVMQATNYLRTADEQALAVQTNIREEFGIELSLRRPSATVVIGHRGHLDAGDMPEPQFDVALRTYNAMLSRVQVITYDQLFAAAEQALRFESV
jgi:hypothetical protein